MNDEDVSMMQGDRPTITAIILNWNRAYLLERTVRSFLSTVSVDYELFLVDNASTDGSRALIESVCSTAASVHALLLPDNRGGEAFNVAMERARGRYIQFSANDVEFLPGWDTEMLRKFVAFPDLGQLSLYSPFPQATLGEVWVEKPATLTTRGGVSVYATDANVGGTSMIRREIWDRGVRWTNYEAGRFKFPADGQFSAEVKQRGYIVAWNDRYLATNWGHNVEEMRQNVDYYVENYAAKLWFGLEGWADRLKQCGFRLVTDRDGKYAIEPDTARDS